MSNYTLTYGGKIVNNTTNQPATSGALDGFYTFEALSNGIWYDLSDYNILSPSRFLLLEEGAVGMPQVEWASERGPDQDGETLIDFHLQPRNLDLVIGALGSDVNDYFARRKLLGNIFAPSKNLISLRWTLPNGDVRQIDGSYASGLALSSSERTAPLYSATAITIRCPNPTFYDPAQRIATFAVPSGTDTFPIPAPIPTGIGASIIDQAVTVAYNGNWQDYPVITIYGPATSLIITNTTTGDVLDFTGWTIPVADVYTIDLRYGYKTVYDAAGITRIDKLTQTSSIETFHLASTREAVGGINSLRVQASAVTTATAIYIRWYDRYLGW